MTTLSLGAGVTGVTRLAGLHAVPPRPRTVPAVQGTLALNLDPLPGLPDVPELRVVTAGPGPVRRWAARFAQALVEVLAGDRSPQQLLRCTSDEVQAMVLRRSATLNAVARPHQRQRRVRAQVRSLHVFQPDPTVAEVSVHVRHGERSRALAVRIEAVDDRWLCTAIEFG